MNEERKGTHGKEHIFRVNRERQRPDKTHFYRTKLVQSDDIFSILSIFLLTIVMEKHVSRSYVRVHLAYPSLVAETQPEAAVYDAANGENSYLGLVYSYPESDYKFS